LKILVTAKRVPDPEENLKFAKGAIDTSSSKWVPNAFDEYAVETALRLAEHVGGKARLAEIVVASVCPKDQRQHVTQFLAMGADRAVVVDADDTQIDSQSVAKLLAEVFKREQCDLVLLGKLSQDDEGCEVPQRLAALLGFPHAAFAAMVEWNRDDGTVTVAREVDDGVETKRIPIPSVVSVDLRVVLPHGVKNNATSPDHAYQEGARLASLRGITMAKRKKVDVLTPSDLGVSVDNKIKIQSVEPPPARPPGQIVGSVEELVEKLATEAKVL
jgi:electron transfer flavoprotein beta subunit